MKVSAKGKKKEKRVGSARGGRQSGDWRSQGQSGANFTREEGAKGHEV